MDPDSSSPTGVHASVTDGRGRALRDGGLGRWLAQAAPRTAHGEVGIALVSDARMRTLNRSYRRKDYPTDVLSFPSGDPPPATRIPQRSARANDALARATGPASRNPQRSGRGNHALDRRRASRIPHSASRPLGDLVIATGVARRQAREAGHSYQTELRVLALHGLLHLLGYDHDDPNDRGRMKRVEMRLRRRGGLAAGLIERL